MLLKNLIKTQPIITQNQNPQQITQKSKPQHVTLVVNNLGVKLRSLYISPVEFHCPPPDEAEYFPRHPHYIGALLN